MLAIIEIERSLVQEVSVAIEAFLRSTQPFSAHPSHSPDEIGHTRKETAMHEGDVRRLT